MARIDNFKGKNGINDLSKRPEDINRSGRKPSIKIQLQKDLSNSDELFIPNKRIVKRAKNGVTIKATTVEQIAAKLFELARSKDGNLSVKAIKLIIESVDGIDLNINDPNQVEKKHGFMLFEVDLSILSYKTLEDLDSHSQDGKINFNKISCAAAREFLQYGKVL